MEHCHVRFQSWRSLTKMRPLVWVLLFVPALVWAEDYTVVVGKSFDTHELSTEIKALVPDYEGATEEIASNSLILRRQTGDFTDAEKALIEQAITVHDPDIRVKRQAKRRAYKASGDAKLKALGLTDEEIEARR